MSDFDEDELYKNEGRSMARRDQATQLRATHDETLRGGFLAAYRLRNATRAVQEYERFDRAQIAANVAAGDLADSEKLLEGKLLRLRYMGEVGFDDLGAEWMADHEDKQTALARRKFDREKERAQLFEEAEAWKTEQETNANTPKDVTPQMSPDEAEFMREFEGRVDGASQEQRFREQSNKFIAQWVTNRGGLDSLNDDQRAHVQHMQEVAEEMIRNQAFAKSATR